MQKYIIPFLSLLILIVTSNVRANDSLKVKKDVGPKLILDFMLLDVPYIKYSAQARSNYKASVPISQSVDPGFNDYALSPFISPSMPQIISYTSSYYNTMNYGIAIGWNKLFDPKKKKSFKIYNAFGSEITAALALILTSKVPFAAGWAHEEFHKNTWTPIGVGSRDEIWNFDLAPDALSYVGSIYDEDLATFKKKDPSGFVRMGAAGIEAQYLLSERIQTQDFLFHTNLPNLAVYWGDFFVSWDYVNRAHTKETIGEHSENYNDESNPLKRDFTGNDFTAWVYDLYNSKESYADRGIHPTGIGIDRYRDYNDLSSAMLDYVEKMANRQWLNIINPFMFRVPEIRVHESLALNLAVRHYLTSFGDDIQLDIYLNYKNHKSIVTFHKYSNHDREWYSGLEMNTYITYITFKESNLIGNIRGMIWSQPDNQSFFTEESQMGGLISFKVAYQNRSVFQPYLEIDTKTNGWVAGIPYLKKKISTRFGFQSEF